MYEVSTDCSLAFGSYKQLLANLAILPPSSGIAVSVVPTSNSDISTFRESSFVQELRLVVLFTSSKNHPDRSNCSSTVVRGFAASRRPKQCTRLRLRLIISPLPEQLESSDLERTSLS